MSLFRRLSLVLALLWAAPSAAQLLGGNTAELTRQVRALQQQLEAIDARLARIEGAGQQNQQLLSLLQEVETLKAEVSRIRGLAEVQGHRMDTLGKRQNDLYLDLDQRLGDLAKLAKPPLAAAALPIESAAPGAAEKPAPTSPPVAAPVAAPVAETGKPDPGAEKTVAEAPSAPVPAAPQRVAEPAPQLDPLVESRTYETALNHFRAAEYAAAISGFKGFLKAYPDSALAPNAQYWIGYSHYALKEYKSALAHQQKLVVAYPGSAKVPDALLNVAANQIALDQLEAGMKTLEELVARHPGTNAAKLASRRLAALSKP